MDVLDLTLRACFALALRIKAGWTFVGGVNLPSRPRSGLIYRRSYFSLDADHTLL